MRNKVKYFFASKNLLLAQYNKIERQLQEAWDECDTLMEINLGHMANKEVIHARHNEANDYLREQLHRVARERDEERRQRRLADIRRKKEEE